MAAGTSEFSTLRESFERSGTRLISRWSLENNDGVTLIGRTDSIEADAAEIFAGQRLAFIESLYPSRQKHLKAAGKEAF